jgi:TatD DNase family protein
LETDAPYLAPSPYRGKRNESSYLTYIVQKIAETKDLTVEEVAAQTTKNANEILDKK